MWFEAELDTRLFNRTTRHLHLTDAGRLFMVRAQAAIDELERGVDELGEALNQAAGVIWISTIGSFGKRHLIPLLSEFLAQYPNIDLEVSFDEGGADLISGGFDIGIRRGRSGDASYISRSLCTLPLILVASPAYLRQRGIPSTPDDLAKHDCIVTRSPSAATPKWSFAGEGRSGASKRRHVVQPRGRLLVAAQLDAVVEAVMAGLGITTLVADTVLPQLQREELKLLLPNYRPLGDTEVFLQYPHRDHVSYRVRLLVDHLIRHFRESHGSRYDWASLLKFAVSA